MANPNRVAAYMPNNPSAYWVFPKPYMAARFAAAVKEMGYQARESAFRVGPRSEFRKNYRVSVYWKAEGAAPDMDVMNAAAMAARD